MIGSDALVFALVIALGLPVGGGVLLHLHGWHWLWGVGLGLLVDVLLVLGWLAWVASVIGARHA